MSQGSLQINGEKLEIEHKDDLTPLWEALSGQEMLEVWLTRPDEVTLAALINPVRGFFIYMTPENPEGWHSLAPTFPEPNPRHEKFRLANGQVDEHPVHWCLPRSELAKVFTEFWDTGNRPSPPDWVYDSAGC